MNRYPDTEKENINSKTDSKFEVLAICDTSFFLQKTIDIFSGLMKQIKEYIEEYYLQNRESPSTTKIAEAVGIARGTAYKYLVEMADRNMKKKT